MNYKEPTLILEEIKKAKKILVNCHWKPDADSVGSALSMYQLLAGMGKNVKIVSPNNIPKNIKFLPLSDNIDVLNVPKVNFENYDLLILLDTPNVKYFSGGVKFSMPSIKSIVIDHHLTNSGYGDINLIDAEASSTAEMLFRIFEDWGVEIEKNMATTLYAGIVSDSGGFLYPAATANTLKVAASLVESGADKHTVDYKLFFSKDLNTLKSLGVMVQKLDYDRKTRISWVALSYDEIRSKKITKNARHEAASSFIAQGVEDSLMGIIMTEEKKGMLSVSIRSRSKIDVSKIAVELGGGGHFYAAGAVVELPYEKAVDKVIEVAKKYAEKID